MDPCEWVDNTLNGRYHVLHANPKGEIDVVWSGDQQSCSFSRVVGVASLACVRERQTRRIDRDGEEGGIIGHWNSHISRV